MKEEKKELLFDRELSRSFRHLDPYELSCESVGKPNEAMRRGSRVEGGTIPRRESLLGVDPFRKQAH